MWAEGKECDRDGERAGRLQPQLAVTGASGAKARSLMVVVN